MARGRTKRVPQDVLDHFGRELRRWVDENFDGNQSKAAKILGVTQSTISGVMTGARGPGLGLLLLLRTKTGKSCDELLGVGPAPPVHLQERLQASLDLEVARFRAEAKATLEEARALVARADSKTESRKAKRG